MALDYLHSRCMIAIPFPSFFLPSFFSFYLSFSVFSSSPVMFTLDSEKLRGIYYMIKNLGTAVGFLLYNRINDSFSSFSHFLFFRRGAGSCNLLKLRSRASFQAVYILPMYYQCPFLFY